MILEPKSRQTLQCQYSIILRQSLIESIRNIYENKKRYNIKEMSKVLIVVDLQNDFCEGGSLAVPKSNEIFSLVNSLKTRKDIFSRVIITRDWHPLHHVSFASTHRQKPFTSIQIEGKVQELWPEHCIAGTHGAQISPLLQVEPSDIILNKGLLVNVDSYSGFAFNSKGGSELKDILDEAKAKEVYVVGLAFDFCVGSTALDAKKCGFKTFVIEQATRSVMAATEALMKEKLKTNEVEIISASKILTN